MGLCIKRNLHNLSGFSTRDFGQAGCDHPNLSKYQMHHFNNAEPKQKILQITYDELKPLKITCKDRSSECTAAVQKSAVRRQPYYIFSRLTEPCVQHSIIEPNPRYHYCTLSSRGPRLYYISVKTHSV